MLSPIKWHLAHTTWFFETFVLADQPDCEVFDERFRVLFNSYYNTVGEQFSRPKRGLLSRPCLSDVREYRECVDKQLLGLLMSEPADPRIVDVIEIGLQHEQQHQELMLTDIKHALSCNPLQPVYRQGPLPDRSNNRHQQWHQQDEGIHWIGHEDDGFCFDNEQPRHRVFLEAYRLSDQLVTCGQYLEFIADGGYRRPELWLSLGWDTVCQQGWQAPLYWQHRDGELFEFTLAGVRELNLMLPVCHVSYFEADAFARWSGRRLPTEAEWEVAASELPVVGNFVDTLWQAGAAIHPGCQASCVEAGSDMYGDVWQWTASPYVAYPGYAPPAGALGEYNGKFMCNQYVLRGGSCATSSTHMRTTYRNFFPPDARWQFSGIRLAD